MNTSNYLKYICIYKLIVPVLHKIIYILSLKILKQMSNF